MNVFINNVDEQSDSGDKVRLSVQTNSRAHRSPQTLIYLYNGMNELNY